LLGITGVSSPADVAASSPIASLANFGILPAVKPAAHAVAPHASSVGRPAVTLAAALPPRASAVWVPVAPDDRPRHG
jgi:hypothetical protein